MKKVLEGSWKWTALIVVHCVLALSAYADEPPKRDLPVPSAASEALRKAIASAGPPLGGLLEQPVPTTTEGWLAMQKASSQGALDKLSEGTGVTIIRDRMAGVPVYRVTPQAQSAHHRGHLLLHLHGGGYLLGGGDAAPGEAALFSGGTGIEAISVDYRMTPLHPFPDGLDDRDLGGLRLFACVRRTHRKSVPG